MAPGSPSRIHSMERLHYWNDGLVSLRTKLHQMRSRARACFESRFEIRQAAKKLVNVIEQCLLARTGKAIPSGSVAGQECKP